MKLKDALAAAMPKRDRSFYRLTKPNACQNCGAIISGNGSRQRTLCGGCVVDPLAVQFL